MQLLTEPYNPIINPPAVVPTTKRPSAPSFPTYDNRDRTPTYPSYPGTNDYNRGGGSSGSGGVPGYVPSGYDRDNDFYGGGGTRPTSRPRYPQTTKSPGGGFFSGFQDAIAGQIGNYVKNAIFNQITGGGGAQGGGTPSRMGGTGSGGSSGNPLSGLFGSGGSGGSSYGGSNSNPLSGLFGGGGSPSGGSSNSNPLSGLFGSGGSSSGGSGGLSGLFGSFGDSNTRPIERNRGTFGLFNENPSANSGNSQTRTTYTSSQPIQQPSAPLERTTPKYGWNV